MIASGDIFSAEDAIKCLEQTKCDGLMLARGVRGNPWLFAEIKQALMQYDAGEEIQISKPQLSEVVEMIRRHGRMQVEYKGEIMGMREMRKHVAWYIQDIRIRQQSAEKPTLLRRMNNWKSFVIRY